MSTRNQHLYAVWGQMMARCYKEHSPQYHRYGGRGITVCESWQSYKTFEQWAATHGYSRTLTIERKNNDKGYSPKNCKWATHKEQANNTSRTLILTAFGETKPCTEWALDLRCAVTYNTLRMRIQYGVDHETAISTKANAYYAEPIDSILYEAFGKRKTLSQWVRETGIPRGTLYARIADYGYTAEEALKLKPRDKPRDVIHEAFGEKKTLYAWGQDSRCCVSYATLAHRVLRLGYKIETAIITSPAPKNKLGNQWKKVVDKG